MQSEEGRVRISGQSKQMVKQLSLALNLKEPEVLNEAHNCFGIKKRMS